MSSQKSWQTVWISITDANVMQNSISSIKINKPRNRHSLLLKYPKTSNPHSKLDQCQLVIRKSLNPCKIKINMLTNINIATYVLPLSVSTYFKCNERSIPKKQVDNQKIAISEPIRTNRVALDQIWHIHRTNR